MAEVERGRSCRPLYKALHLGTFIEWCFSILCGAHTDGVLHWSQKNTEYGKSSWNFRKRLAFRRSITVRRCTGIDSFEELHKSCY